MLRDMVTGLYPLSEPYREHMLDVGDGHQVYVAEYGNPEGLPVVVFHGGPGSASKPKHAQVFHPEKYRIILFDQRGCGQSLPAGELKENTTQKLLHDAELVRTHLNISAWHVFGGSWGSTLALLYAQNYRSSVLSLVVYGVFLADEFASRWMNGEGQNFIYPEAYEDFKKAVLVDGQTDTRTAVIEALLEGDAKRQAEVSNAFSVWHLCGMNMEVSDFDPSLMSEEEVAAGVVMNRIFAHFDKNSFFIDEGQILRDMPKLKGLPGYVLQGRFDMCCPPKAAFDVHKAWDGSALVMVQEASHSTSAPHLSQALVNVTDTLWDRFSN